MAELRRDPIVGRWVIVNTESPCGPDGYEKEKHTWSGGVCPFCYGNESMTPPEIEAFRDSQTKPNTPGWQVRTVSNKFPALQVEGDLDRKGIGIYDMSNGIGAHEVIIESPYHQKALTELLDEEVEEVIKMYLRRCQDLREDKRFKYILIFKNQGPSAGASLEHSHTQLIALPMVPKNVVEELRGSGHYFDYRERCIFCDIITQELENKERVILENEHFLSFCPFVSRFPFEAWIIPKTHQSAFCYIEGEEITNLARILKQTLLRIKTVLSDPAYNFIIHTSPIDDAGRESYHWHIEIMPKLMRIAGFEWGTGFYMVPTPPEAAAKYLRETKL